MTSEHVKIWLNDSQWIGLVVKPYSYRVDFSPTFFPRFSVGDTKGLDQTRWRSWVQSRFDEGEGQIMWSSALSTNRYAQGHLVEVGRPSFRFGQYTEPLIPPVNLLGAANQREDSVAGDIGTSLFPQVTSQGLGLDSFRDSSGGKYKTLIGNMAVYFTDKYPAFVVEWSGRPAMWHWQSAWVYTDVADPYAWDEGAVEASSSKLTGKWALLWQYVNQGNDAYVSDVVIYSQITHIALKGALHDTQGLYVYGTVHTLGLTPATFRAPAYTWGAEHLAVYDEKLWRSNGGEVYYLEPSAGTVPAHWETYIPGDAGEKVLNMREFNGRLYIGKANALWTFDAGRLYRVEDFSSYTDKWNFSHMTVHRGFMYFNIKHMLFRLSTAGTLEQIQTYPSGGTIPSAVSVGDKLYYIARSPGIHPNTDVWMFDPEMGANYRLFSASRVGWPNWKSPRSLGTVHGLLTVSPISYTMNYVLNTAIWTGGHPINAPIMAIDPVTPSMQQQIPGYAESDAWFATSMLDFGLPTLPKAFKRITVDYELINQAADYIDVYYVTQLKRHSSLMNSFEVDPWDGTYPASTDDTLIDGDLTTGRNFRFGPNGYPIWAVGIKAAEGVVHNQIVPRPDIMGVRWVAKYAPTGEPLDKRTEIVQDQHFFPMRWVNGSWDFVYDWDDLRVSYQGGLNPGDPLYMVIDYVIPSTGDYCLQAVYTSEVSGGQFSDARGLQHWIGLWTIIDFQPGEFAAREVQLTSSIQPAPVEGYDWTYLGRIGGYSNPSLSKVEDTRKSLSFPVGLTSEQIMLKFDFHGSPISRPVIRRYEIEWMPVPGQLRTYNFIIPIAENIEMPDLSIRSNASSVVATVFSLAGAGKPYVCQLPWPGTHTISATVHIVPPGGAVPSLRDDNIDDSAAELPIQLDML